MLPTNETSSDVAPRILRETPNAHAVSEHVYAVIAGQYALYAKTGANSPWVGYLAFDQQTGDLLGSCSFILHQPSDGMEIAYFTFPPYEGRGVATAMARELLAVAAEHGNPDLHAFTLPEVNPSTRVLQSLGFVRAGHAQDEEAGVVWRWDLVHPLRTSKRRSKAR